MNTTTKAVIASALVIALALVAVSGVTYSWFSDTERSEISVNTATIDIDGKYTGTPDVKSITNPNATNLGTTAEYTTDSKDLTVNNLLANRSITATYELTNKSTVPTTFRMYMALDGISDALTSGAVKIMISGGSDTLSVTETTLAFSNSVAYILGSGSTGVTMPAVSGSSASYTYTIKIETDVASSNLPNFSVRMVMEAYQSDFTYTPVVVMSSGSATLSGTSAVTVSGTANKVSFAPSVDVTAEFSAGAMSAITNSGGVSDVGLTVTSLEPEGTLAKVQLSLANAHTTDFGADNWVTVSVKIQGQYTGVTVTYDGAGDQPQLMGVVYDETTGYTTVTFKTNHFSVFVIESTEWYEVSNMEELQAASLQYLEEYVECSIDEAVTTITNSNGERVYAKAVLVPNPDYKPFIRLSDSWDNEANKMTSASNYVDNWKINGKVTIDLNGKTIINEGTSCTKIEGTNYLSVDNDVTILNGTFEIRGYTEAIRVNNGGIVSYHDVKFTSTNNYTELVQTYERDEGDHLVLLFDGCTFNNGYLNIDSGSYRDDDGNQLIFTYDVTITGCTFTSDVSKIGDGLIDTGSYANGSIAISDTRMELTGTTTNTSVSFVHIDALYALSEGDGKPVDLTLTNVTMTMDDADTKMVPVSNRMDNSSTVTATGCTFSNGSTQVDVSGNPVTA